MPVSPAPGTAGNAPYWESLGRVLRIQSGLRSQWQSPTQCKLVLHWTWKSLQQLLGRRPNCQNRSPLFAAEAVGCRVRLTLSPQMSVNAPDVMRPHTAVSPQMSEEPLTPPARTVSPQISVSPQIKVSPQMSVSPQINVSPQMSVRSRTRVTWPVSALYCTAGEMAAVPAGMVSLFCSAAKALR